MKKPCCVKCGGTDFESRQHQPQYCPYNLLFVVCSGCGGVAGIIDRVDVPAMVESIKNTLEKNKRP